MPDFENFVSDSLSPKFRTFCICAFFLDDSRDGDEKGVLEDGFNVNKDKRGKSIGREQQEQKTHMGGDQFYGRMSNLPIGERGEMEGFWRKPQADMECD